MPSGFYRIELLIANVWWLQIDTEIISEIKTSFWKVKVFTGFIIMGFCTNFWFEILIFWLKKLAISVEIYFQKINAEMCGLFERQGFNNYVLVFENCRLVFYYNTLRRAVITIQHLNFDGFRAFAMYLKESFVNVHHQFIIAQQNFVEMKYLYGFVLITFLTSTSGVMRSRFKSMKCTVFNETVLTNNFCYLKSYSRTYVTLNWGETRHLPVGRPIDVNFTRKKNSAQFFQQVF